MPWQERRAMSLRIEFVERASKPGANVSALCREFGISRETGHKWLQRFREHGYDGLEERSRRPANSPCATGEEIVLAVLAAREAHPRWGPKKLVDLLRKRLKDDTPSRATIARILQRFGQVRRRKRKAPVSVLERAPDVVAKASNEVWTVDFQGLVASRRRRSMRAAHGPRCAQPVRAGSHTAPSDDRRRGQARVRASLPTVRGACSHPE